MNKITLHSAVDLITNSSTVIYTYAGNSQQAVKNLVNEMLKVFKSIQTFDDLFYSDVFLTEIENYNEYIPENVNINDVIQQVLKQEIEKPEWMIEAERQKNYNGYAKETSFYLEAKNEEFKQLAEKILSVLYAQDHEAGYDN